MGEYIGSTTVVHGRRWWQTLWLTVFVIVVLAGTVSLAVSRLVYEWHFPAWLWAGRPLPVVGLALATIVAAATTFCRSGQPVVRLFPFVPLLLNLIWLADPSVDLIRSRFLFMATVWLAAVLLGQQLMSWQDIRWRPLGLIFVVAALVPVYLSTMSQAVGEADAFEFQVVAPQLGIAHPTGYPLYLLLGKMFSFLPMGTIAWRLNVASAVYAVVAAMLVYLVALRLIRQPLPSLVGAVALGFVPVFWSQAIIAEVYTLHALIVATVLRLMIRVLDDDGQTGTRFYYFWDNRKALVALAFFLGLGLTNHLTTVFLLPAAAVTFVLYAIKSMANTRQSRITSWSSLALLLSILLIAFLLPLTLYAYLPWRWQVLNNEPMGISRFVDWVVGGRFQGALQWSAWLRDPARWGIVARLILDAWGAGYLILAAIGALSLFKRLWPVALILLMTAAGFTFYTLNYYVPDLAVFLIPTHVIIAIWVAAGAATLFGLLEGRVFRGASWVGALARVVLFTLALTPLLWRAAENWQGLDQSLDDGGETWARGVFAEPLVRGGAILADSEKIAPLYYLQQIQGFRPDLDIMVLPDEAAYRAELDTRIAAGQTVYLARFLPGLAGEYHLRSAGPLVEVSPDPLDNLPGDITPTHRVVGPLRLLGFRSDEISAFDPTKATMTLYWMLDQSLAAGDPLPVLYLRWHSGDNDEIVVQGKHPVHDYYPLNAWRPNEIVVDTHIIPVPWANCPDHGADCRHELQIAVAPRFARVDELEWLTIESMNITARTGPVGKAQRVYLDGFALDGIDIDSQARLATPLSFRYSGFDDGPGVAFTLVPAHAKDSMVFPVRGGMSRPVQARESLIRGGKLPAAADSGRHLLLAMPAAEALGAVCGWLAWPSSACVVGEIEIDGVALPQGAINFDDQIALLDIDLPPTALVPGGHLSLTIRWQALSALSENYTVFLQVLDAQDRIVGQVDAWPVQGTYPTNQWQPGEIVDDPHVIQLSQDMMPGTYRLHVGFYLLSTLERLPVVDDAGLAIDDKVEFPLVTD